jgi:hypothetical protein
MQAKDLKDEVILRELAKHQGTWATYGEKEYHMPNIQLKTYPDAPRKNLAC